MPNLVEFRKQFPGADFALMKRNPKLRDTVRIRKKNYTGDEGLKRAEKEFLSFFGNKVTKPVVAKTVVKAGRPAARPAGRPAKQKVSVNKAILDCLIKSGKLTRTNLHSAIAGNAKGEEFKKITQNVNINLHTLTINKLISKSKERGGAFKLTTLGKKKTA